MIVIILRIMLIVNLISHINTGKMGIYRKATQRYFGTSGKENNIASQITDSLTILRQVISK